MQQGICCPFVLQANANEMDPVELALEEDDCEDGCKYLHCKDWHTVSVQRQSVVSMNS